MLKGKIFIQIASYRDPQLLPTLKNCIENAEHPENLVFGIGWQHCNCEKWDTLDKYKDDPRFRIIDIPYKESLGACWIRNKIQQVYGGEEYTLQLDSHHRFIPNWDTEIISMYENLKTNGIEKPLITAYIPSYNPENDPAERVQEPWMMNFDRFIPEGAVFFMPATIPGWETKTLPIPARFYSAHFAFTTGEFCNEVQHDPKYYFHGEEISIAARAYTHGYDLFHPHKVIAWHEYTRRGRIKHWDDFPTVWGNLNKDCHDRNRILFGMDGEDPKSIDFGKYGFGTKRTLHDYEVFTGLSFSKRAVQKYTLDNNIAPNPTYYETTEEWEESLCKWFKHFIDIGYDRVPEKDYDFWCVAFENDKGETIYRKDADEAEIARYMSDPDHYVKLLREFETEEKPVRAIVWPHSISKEWCERMSFDIP